MSAVPAGGGGAGGGRRAPSLTLDLGATRATPTGGVTPASPPPTPSSIFSRSPLPRDSVLSAVLLSYWDNILGPRVRHLWGARRTGIGALQRIAAHTLSGEICRGLADAVVDARVFADADLLVVSFVFGATGTRCSQREPALHSLSLLLPAEARDLYMPWHALCLSRLARLIAQLRILLHQRSGELALEAFSTNLNHFVGLLISLRDQALPRTITLSETLLDDKSSLAYLRRVITSHLMTCGRTVVLGRSLAKINQMVSTLSLFLSAEERACCRYAAPTPVVCCYEPDVCVQGMLQTSAGSESATLKDMHLSRYPSTVVNVSLKDVRLSSLPHEHAEKRRAALRQELASLWSAAEGEAYPTSGLLQTFDGTDTLVKTLIDELVLLPTGHGVREAYVGHFNRLLLRRATSLLAYVTAESRAGRSAVKLRPLRHALSLTAAADFRIVLAAAEKLQPGVYGFVCRSRGDATTCANDS